LLIAAETLVAAGIPMKRAMKHVQALRSARYASLAALEEPSAAEKLKAPAPEKDH
jgi:hypothetical protein